MTPGLTNIEAGIVFMLTLVTVLTKRSSAA